MRHPRFSLWTGRFERSADRGLVHRIDYIEVFAAARGQGLGARVHGRQVYWGTIHGVDRLSLTAARAPDKNGYITWPVFGYDGKIPDRIREVMPERLRAFAMIQDLLEDDEGADWWHDEGKTIALTFDLTEGSDQRRRWATYWKIRTRSRVDPPS